MTKNLNRRHKKTVWAKESKLVLGREIYRGKFRYRERNGRRGRVWQSVVQTRGRHVIERERKERERERQRERTEREREREWTVSYCNVQVQKERQKGSFFGCMREKR